MKEMVKRAVPYLLDCMHEGFENNVWNLALDNELSDLKGLLDTVEMHGVEHQDLLDSLEEPILKLLMLSRNRMKSFRNIFSMTHGHSIGKEVDDEAEGFAWKIYNKHHNRGTKETNSRLAKAKAIYRNKEQMVMECLEVLLLASGEGKSTKEDKDCISFLTAVALGLHEDEDWIV